MTTTAVNLDLIGYNDGDQPLCPSCISGRLHPYAVTFSLARAVNGVHHTSERVDWLEGWVAVCVGNRDYRRYQEKLAAEYPNEPDWQHIDSLVEPCGFSMPLTPRRRSGS
jgi:hypothetical protein